MHTIERERARRRNVVTVPCDVTPVLGYCPHCTGGFYTAAVECENCGAPGMLSIPKGHPIPVYNQRCAICGCKGLKR